MFSEKGYVVFQKVNGLFEQKLCYFVAFGSLTIDCGENKLEQF
jgi:hypothetical protein